MVTSNHVYADELTVHGEHDAKTWMQQDLKRESNGILVHKRGSKGGGFIHASRAAGSILLSTSDICKHHMHGPTNVVMLQHIAH
jgi:hypothetical protein